MVNKHKKLAKMVVDGKLVFHTPTFILDHRKIYLLKADDGRTRVIKSSANMTGRAWNGEHMEFYEFDDSLYCYEEYERDFETAWKNSEKIPMSVISAKKADDLVEGNAFLKDVKETGRTIILQEPDANVSFEYIKYVIDHENCKKEYNILLDKVSNKSKNGFVEIVPKMVEKIEHNKKKLLQQKVKTTNITERYPVMSFDFYNKEIKLNDEILNLQPSENEVKRDIEELLGLFRNFDDFVGNKEKLKETHFKLVNAIFSSPFNAKIRCTAKIRGISTSSLPLFLLAASSTANCGKTFTISAILKMMTGKELPSTNKEDCKKDDIRATQVGCKGIPVFIDELDNKYLSTIKDIIKNPEKCEENQLEEQPMILFASNDVLEPDEILRKRMVFLRFEGALPSTVDQSAYKGMGNAIKKRLGTGLYREYLRRMMGSVTEMLDYMVHCKNIPDSWYPDLMAVSSETILDILRDYGYDIPKYMRHLTWNDDYSVNASFIADNAINEIKSVYKHNKKSFILNQDSVTIELGNDKDSEKKCKSWINTLPPEMRAKMSSTRECNRITVDRMELEKRMGMKFGFFAFLRR